MIATKPIRSLCDDLAPEGGEGVCQEELKRIEEEVRGAAYRIIEAKSATYYGIGMALSRITRAMLGDENSVLTVSAMLCGEYGQSDVYAGVPCIINKNGIFRVLTLDLNEEEQERFGESCDTLRSSFSELGK